MSTTGSVPSAAAWVVAIDGERRVAIGAVDEGPSWLTPRGTSLWTAVRWAADGDVSGLDPLPMSPLVLSPLVDHEVWAAGVTFTESKEAREEESLRAPHYEHVYLADRPELFFKGAGARVVGPDDTIGIRADSTWDVPEAELGLAIDPEGQVVAYTLGNDVSSRSIEGENPLYLPQAKVYERSCSLGPCLVPAVFVAPLQELDIRLEVVRAGSVVVDGSYSMSQLRREPADLVHWLTRARSYPDGVVLLCGTGFVPTNFTLMSGDTVRISAPGLGTLTNQCQVVGAASSAQAVAT